jgi:hypothetical protein
MSRQLKVIKTLVWEFNVGTIIPNAAGKTALDLANSIKDENVKNTVCCLI